MVLLFGDDPVGNIESFFAFRPSIRGGDIAAENSRKYNGKKAAGCGKDG